MQMSGRSDLISSGLGMNSRASAGVVVMAPALVGGDVGRGWWYSGAVEARITWRRAKTVSDTRERVSFLRATTPFFIALLFFFLRLFGTADI